MNQKIGVSFFGQILTLSTLSPFLLKILFLKLFLLQHLYSIFSQICFPITSIQVNQLSSQTCGLPGDAAPGGAPRLGSLGSPLSRL